LHGLVLRADDRLRAGQAGQGLVAVSRQQQSLEVGADAAALRKPGEQRVEVGGVVLQRARCGRAGTALGHCEHLRAQAAEMLLYTPSEPQATNYR
jgi:hypothetical protein